MLLTRRQVLQGTAALTAFPAHAGRSNSDELLQAKVSEIQLLPESYARTRIWGYAGTLPGPEIRLKQGGMVRKKLLNELPQPTSTHWHGIRIDNAMDGVAGLTQEAVQPGAAFDYEFVVPDAGTYWYHSHNRSFEQVARGLYGALIVEEPSPMDIDRDEVLILDDWRIDPGSGQIADGFGALHDLSHAGRLGNFIGTNGFGNLALDVKRHERLRLRIINASNARVFQLSIVGLDGWIVALDGMPLSEPRAVTGILDIGPAQRADLIVDVTSDVGDTAHIVRHQRDGTFSQVALNVRGNKAAKRRGVTSSLSPIAQPKLDLGSATRFELKMEGGAMGGMRSAVMDGEQQSMQSLMRAQQFWAFNGAIGSMDGPPLAELSLGQSVRLTIANDTAFPHAMHLHGMHFWEIQADGSLGDFRDTTLVAQGSTQEIAFVADNPGDWLLHCHMLSHAVSGMMTSIRVAA